MNFTGPFSDYLNGTPWPRPLSKATSMRKIRTTAGFPIPIDELLQDLSIDSTDDQATVNRMARAAADFLEKRTGMSVLAGRYEALFNDWCWYTPWEFSRTPLRSIVEISWLDGTNSPPTWSEVSVGDFFVQPIEKTFLIVPLKTFVAPTIWAPFAGIRVRFDAGYDIALRSGEDPGDQVSDDPAFDDEGEPHPLPDDLKWSLIALTGHYYENRELFAADKIAEIELGAGSLLAANRQFW